LAAGCVAGAAVTVECQAVVVLVLLLAYVALQGGRAAGLYALGSVPGLVLLGVYDWGAFGSPWHPSYRYLDNSLRNNQLGGILGVHLPTLHGVQTTLVGNRGVLILAPVLVAAAAGL